METKKIVAISDTHNKLHEIVDKIPEGDILVHTGDLTVYGRQRNIRIALQAIADLPHRDKVIIAGNHDSIFEDDPYIAKAIVEQHESITYLQDQFAEVQGVKFYGSPWTPKFYHWSFMLERGSQALQRKWSFIPEGVDVLPTHGPPFGVLDVSEYGKKSVGCELLRDEVNLKKPRFHVFGHIHGDNGILEKEHTTFINAAICSPRHIMEQTIHVFEVEI